MRIRAFIFDLDGVITDTAEYHYLSWKQLADEEGIPFTKADNDALRGVSRRESLKRLLKGRAVPEEQVQEWMERKNGYYLQHLSNLKADDCLPGVKPFLEEARAKRIRLGIGSASKNAHLVLERLSLSHYFEAIGDGYSVVNPKPAPDLFVWVAGGLHVTVSEVVVFEDAQVGIDAAKQAGCHTVSISHDNIERADLHLPKGFDGVSVTDVLRHLQVEHSTHQ